MGRILPWWALEGSLSQASVIRKGRDFPRKDERTEPSTCTFSVKNVYKKGERLDLGQSLPNNFFLVPPPPPPPEGWSQQIKVTSIYLTGWMERRHWNVDFDSKTKLEISSLRNVKRVCMFRGTGGGGLGGTLCLLSFHFIIMRLENYCQTNSLNDMNSIHVL